MTVLLCIFVGLGAAYIKGRLSLLPDQIVDEMDIDVPYKSVFCTGKHLDEACQMTRPHYKDQYVAPDRAEQWRLKSPTGFVQIVNCEGKLCACFGVLALSKSFMDQFIKGNVTDLDLTAEDILGEEDAKKSTDLYISGVIVRGANTFKGRKRAAVMMWALVTYLKVFYGTRRQRRIYALAVTKQSEVALKNFGFTVASRANGRKDHHNLYLITIKGSADWKRLSVYVNDCSALCGYEYVSKGMNKRRAVYMGDRVSI